MQKVKSIFFLVPFMIGIFFSCSKGGTTAVDDGTAGGHGSVPSDTTAPVLSITNPIDNQVFTSGAAFNITGNINDDYGLYQGYVRIVNDANGVELKKQAYEIHGIKSYNFTVPFTPSVTTPADYTVTVFFEDHGNNNVTKLVKIKVNP
jgi:hypothetical protein